MAGVFARQRFTQIATGVSLKTIAQLVAPANQALKIGGFGIGFQGTSNTDAPILVQLVRQTTGGTMSAGTVVKANDVSTAVQTTAQENATVEPTPGDILWSQTVHPQTGIEVREGTMTPIEVPGGGRLGLVVTAGVTQNASGHLAFEE